MSACCGCACNHLAEDSPFVQMDKKYRVTLLSILFVTLMDFPRFHFQSLLLPTKTSFLNTNYHLVAQLCTCW